MWCHVMSLNSMNSFCPVSLVWQRGFQLRKKNYSNCVVPSLICSSNTRSSLPTVIICSYSSNVSKKKIMNIHFSGLETITVGSKNPCRPETLVLASSYRANVHAKWVHWIHSGSVLILVTRWHCSNTEMTRGIYLCDDTFYTKSQRET